MKGDTPDKPINLLSGSPSAIASHAPLKLDPEDFREEIAELELNDEQAHELLQNLWHIMSIFVDMGWGVDTLQLVLPELHKDLAQDSKELLDSREPSCSPLTEKGTDDD